MPSQPPLDHPSEPPCEACVSGQWPVYSQSKTTGCVALAGLSVDPVDAAGSDAIQTARPTPRRDTPCPERCRKCSTWCATKHTWRNLLRTQPKTLLMWRVALAHGIYSTLQFAQRRLPARRVTWTEQVGRRSGSALWKRHEASHSSADTWAPSWCIPSNRRFLGIRRHRQMQATVPVDKAGQLTTALQDGT